MVRVYYGTRRRRLLVEPSTAACAAGRCDDAVRALERALFAQPANPEIHFRLGACHSGACRTHALVAPAIAAAYLCRSVILLGRQGDSRARAIVLDALAHVYASEKRLPAAIACSRHAARLYLEAGQVDQWAREEYNLGNLCCELSEAGTPRWRDAVRHYENALGPDTPERYAAVLENLGTAYRRLPEGCHKAIQCYRKALRTPAIRRSPQRRAALHNNLGNAWLSMPFDDAAAGLRNGRRALRHFGQALLARTRAANPFDHAVTQYNRGFAFLRLAAPDAAAACFRDAAECFSGCGAQDWAAISIARSENRV